MHVRVDEPVGVCNDPQPREASLNRRCSCACSCGCACQAADQAITSSGGSLSGKSSQWLAVQYTPEG